MADQSATDARLREHLTMIHRLADAGTSWAKDTTRTRIRTLAREALLELDNRETDFNSPHLNTPVVPEP